MAEAPKFAQAVGHTSTHLTLSVEPSALDLDNRLDPKLDQGDRVPTHSLPEQQGLEGSSEGREEIETVGELRSEGQGLVADDGSVFVTPITLDPLLGGTGYLIPASLNNAASNLFRKRVGQVSEGLFLKRITIENFA